MSGLRELGSLWNSIQKTLFPVLEDHLGELTEQQRLMVTVCETCDLTKAMAAFRWQGIGCPPKSRLCLCKAFIAKAVWGFPTTRDLIAAVRQQPVLRRLCGWESLSEVPSEATFSRAFAAFAESSLPKRLHAELIERKYKDKLVGHVSRDSTAIEARERAVSKAPIAPDEPPTKRPRGRPRKGEIVPPKEPTRLQRQETQTLPEMMAELPTECDWGCKRNSQGSTERWRGYKAHLDVADGDVPVNFLLSSASMHDSQAAFPLALTTAQRLTNLYDLADAAYDAKEIRNLSNRLGHVAIIDYNPRRGPPKEFTPAEAVRYRERSAVERVNSHLHDAHGGRHVRVRGALKVAAHLAFGILVIAVEQLLKIAT